MAAPHGLDGPCLTEDILELLLRHVVRYVSHCGEVRAVGLAGAARLIAESLNVDSPNTVQEGLRVGPDMAERGAAALWADYEARGLQAMQGQGHDDGVVGR